MSLRGDLSPEASADMPAAQLEVDRTRATHREIDMMKSRIESSEHLSSLKVSLVAALAVISERFTSLIARVEKMEQSSSAKKEKKAERKKFTKADIKGPQTDTFVHVAGMGLKDGEMKSTGMPETVGWSRDPMQEGRCAQNLSLDPVLVQFLCQAGLDPKTMSPAAIAEAKEFAEKENLHGVVREAEKRTQRKKKMVARSSSSVSMKGAASPRPKRRSSTTQQNKELQARIFELETLVREMYVQGEETRERVARMEEALAHLLGQKFDQPGHLDHLDHPGHLDHLDHLDHPGHLDHLPAAEQAGSQYQSAEQLIDNDHHQLISRQISAIMEQQRSHLEEEDEEVTQGEDPFNIPDEEEFFIARQTLRTTTNQTNMRNGALFGCSLLEQQLEEYETTSGKNVKIPPFVWKSVEKLESEQEYLETDGLYRVPGDVNKIQKIRAELDQNEWATFDGCADAAVIAGALKLFLRELPQPLLPYNLHRELVEAAKKTGPHGDDVARSMQVVLAKIDSTVVLDTLEVLVMHLGRVAEADNRMDIENLGLLFGQGFLWPDPMAPVDMQFFSDTANNCQVATALIRFRKEIFCQDPVVADRGSVQLD